MSAGWWCCWSFPGERSFVVNAAVSSVDIYGIYKWNISHLHHFINFTIVNIETDFWEFLFLFCGNLLFCAGVNLDTWLRGFVTVYFWMYAFFYSKVWTLKKHRFHFFLFLIITFQSFVLVLHPTRAPTPHPTVVTFCWNVTYWRMLHFWNLVSFPFKHSSKHLWCPLGSWGMNSVGLFVILFSDRAEKEGTYIQLFVRRAVRQMTHLVVAWLVVLMMMLLLSCLSRHWTVMFDFQPVFVMFGWKLQLTGNTEMPACMIECTSTEYGIWFP